MWTIDRAVLERIRAAAGTSETEVCGALFGRRGAIAGVAPLPNQSDHAAASYYIPAEAVLAAERAAEAHGTMLVGFYHSHPRGPAVPSRADTEAAVPGYLYLIAARAGELRAWQLRDDRSGFDEIDLATRDDDQDSGRAP